MSNRLTPGLLITFAVTLVVQASIAAPDIDAVLLFDGGDSTFDRFEDIYHRSEGGYYVCGHSNGRSWVLCLDQDDEEVWSMIRGQACGPYGDVYTSIIETDGGDALVGGKIASLFTVALLDKESGEEIWSRDYTNDGGWCRSVIELKSGDFAIAGHHMSRQAYLAMIRPNGETIWEMNFQDQDNSTVFKSIRETDDGIVVAGDAGEPYMRSPEYAHAIKGILVKVDFEGDIVWSRTYENEIQFGNVPALVSRNEGGFAFGSARSHVRIGDGIYYGLTMVNELGEVIDDDYYQNRDTGEYISGMDRLSDGGFVMVGAMVFARPENLGGRRSYRMTRVSAEGDLLWSTTFPELVGDGWPGHYYYNYWFLRSVIVLPDDQIVACGEYCSDVNNRISDAVILRFVPDHLGPMMISRSPEDSLIDVLVGSSVEFVVRARSREGWQMEYEWLMNDTLIGDDDTTTTIQFNELGVDTVSCRLSSNEFVTETGWIVTVTDLFIASHSPDTLSLTYGRGPVSFSVDSVAAINRNGLTYFWAVSYENEVVAEIVDTSRITFDFDRSGNYQVEGIAYIPEGPQDNVIWNVAVRGAIWSFEPEQTELTGILDTTVQFMILPTVSDSLNWFTWQYDGGMIREGWDSTFEMNFFELGEHTITGILTDSVESDTVNWTVLVKSNSVPPSLSLEPSALSLSVSPNPFNSTLTIRFQSAKSAQSAVQLSIYDLSGREVARLIDSKSEIRNQKSEIVWNASAVPAGVYLVRLQQGTQVSTRKVVLLR